jgi:glycosyltransferase involved in cell wall biosynthesis
MMPHKTDIIMVTWQRPEITRLTIHTIRRNTKPENHRLVVIDNGSTKEMTEELTMMQDNGYIDELVLIGANLGLEPARNIGLALVQSDWFVCADNDCLPEPITDDKDWLDRLHEIVAEDTRLKSIACRTQVMIGTGNIFEDETKDYIIFPHPGGSLRLMHTRTVRDLGGWRNEVKGRGSEERYIGGVLAYEGHLSAFATHVHCLHLFGKKDITDRWGYNKDWKPEQTGHSDIWHPALEQGDIEEQVIKYAGRENAQYYFDEQR